MKTIRTLGTFILIVSLTNLFSQSARYKGVNNDPNIDPNFGKGSDVITASIEEDLNHLNLFEYAHALPELYSLIENGIVSEKEWKAFVDSLLYQVNMHKNDTVRPYWAVDYLGLIPMQAQFFLASVDKSQALNQKYPEVHRTIVNNTSSMEVAYRPEDYDSLVTLTDGTAGTTNFWYFFQLEGSSILDLASSTISKEKLEIWCRDYEIVATYKTPYYLQKRKWEMLVKRLKHKGGYFEKISKLMLETIDYALFDKNHDYYSRALMEGMNRDKIKEF